MTYRNNGLYSAIADENRRRILDILSSGEKSAGEIAEQFDMSRPAVAKHLRILEENQLIKIRQVGRERLHQLSPEPLREVHEWTEQYQRFWKGRLQGLKQVLEDSERDGSA